MNGIGYTNFKQGNYQQALEYCLRGLELNEAINNGLGTSSSLINLGDIYSAQGKYANALENYQRSIKIKETLNDKN
ncbi:MAG: tetratricopeptide repeat protein [Bacteroidia bacterium]